MPLVSWPWGSSPCDMGRGQRHERLDRICALGQQVAPSNLAKADVPTWVRLPGGLHAAIEREVAAVSDQNLGALLEPVLRAVVHSLLDRLLERMAHALALAYEHARRRIRWRVPEHSEIDLPP